MKKINLNQILNLLEINQIKDNDVMVEYVSNDIKKIRDKAVIFHVNKAEEINQEKFKNLKNCYIITDQALLKDMINKDHYFFVSNVASAYFKFINYYRSLFHIPVVAVTGTCGKTTTKEMISQILRKNYQVVSTYSSKNALRFHNDYLMSFDEHIEFGVFETAITHPGHLILGCEYFKPTIGIITTIGIDHLNWCKTLNNYIRTKSEILIGLNNQGVLIINGDDENIAKIDMSNYQGKIVTFGINSPAEFFGENISYGDGGMNFTLRYGNNKYLVYVPGYGNHNVYNALATLAALTYLKIDLKESIDHLKSFRHIKSHNQLYYGLGNSIIIDDTWSSNPTSMAAALDVLKAKGSNKTKVAVIGKISYLGKYANIYYRKIAKMMIRNHVDLLITQDEESCQIVKYAIKYGMNSEKCICTKDNRELYRVLKNILSEKTIVLFKCSMLDKSNQDVLKKIIVREVE